MIYVELRWNMVTSEEALVTRSRKRRGNKERTNTVVVEVLGNVMTYRLR